MGECCCGWPRPPVPPPLRQALPVTCVHQHSVERLLAAACTNSGSGGSRSSSWCAHRWGRQASTASPPVPSTRTRSPPSLPRTWRGSQPCLKPSQPSSSPGTSPAQAPPPAPQGWQGTHVAADPPLNPKPQGSHVAADPPHLLDPPLIGCTGFVPAHNHTSAARARAHRGAVDGGGPCPSPL